MSWAHSPSSFLRKASTFSSFSMKSWCRPLTMPRYFLASGWLVRLFLVLFCAFFLEASCCWRMLRQASMRSQATGSVRSSLQRYSHSVCRRSFLLSPPEMAEMMEMNRFTIQRLCSILILTSIKLSIIQLLQAEMFGVESLFVDGAAQLAGGHGLLEDPQVIPHLATMLATIQNTKTPGDIVHLSNLAKQTHPKPHHHKKNIQEMIVPLAQQSGKVQEKGYILKPFGVESQKLQWAGVSMTKEEIALIDEHLVQLADRHKAKEIRFWGKILGSSLDYYVVQGVVGQLLTLEDTVKGGEKRGEGVNYYTFWAANNLLSAEWIELPLINPEHIKVARKVKKYFTGHLESQMFTTPTFHGLEKHYLKAQLVRMTSSLQIVPKGIFKPNDDNPKLVDYEDEPKQPEFAELATPDSWVHRNLNVLNLGRCTHYIDPATPEDQLEAITAELAEKDPELERLRGITEDKLPEGSPFGVENIWQVRVVGDSQVFQKDEGSSVYGVVVLKNLYWPGWVTVGYKSGYSNFYLGSGHKWTQPGWNNYENASLGEQAEDVSEYPEPNPKEQPKAAQPVAEQAVQQ